VATRSADGVGLISVSAIPAGGPVGRYSLYEHDDYKLRFRVRGYYRMDQDPPPVLVNDKP